MKQVSEIQSIKDVLHHLDSDTHLFLDVDNTLLAPTRDFGSEHWEHFVAHHFMEKGIPEAEAFNRSSDIWKAIQTVIEIDFAEPHTAEVIEHVRAMGCPVFAITARSYEFFKVTHRQLGFLGIEFSESQEEYMLANPAVFSKGVFFCGGYNKGQVIKSYVDVHQCKKIVMVDDNVGHLRNALEALEIPFVGLRYGYLDKRKKNYVPDEVSRLLCQVFIHPEAAKFLKRGLF